MHWSTLSFSKCISLFSSRCIFAFSSPISSILNSLDISFTSSTCWLQWRKNQTHRRQKSLGVNKKECGGCETGTQRIEDMSWKRRFGWRTKMVYSIKWMHSARKFFISAALFSMIQGIKCASSFKDTLRTITGSNFSNPSTIPTCWRQRTCRLDEGFLLRRMRCRRSCIPSLNSILQNLIRWSNASWWRIRES